MSKCGLCNDGYTNYHGFLKVFHEDGRVAIACPTCIKSLDLNPEWSLKPQKEEKQQGLKYDKGNGKSLDHLCPPFVKHMMCRALEYGISKYFENSWRMGFKLSRVYDSLNHHIDAFFHERQDIDPESGYHHLDLALFNLAMMRYSVDIKGMDDRPPVTQEQIAEVFRLGMIEVEKRKQI